MGGDILVKSEEGFGSVFDVYIVNKSEEDLLRPEMIRLEFDPVVNKSKNKKQKIKIVEENLYRVERSLNTRPDSNIPLECLDEDYKDNYDPRVFLEENQNSFIINHKQNND